MLPSSEAHEIDIGEPHLELPPFDGDGDGDGEPDGNHDYGVELDDEDVGDPFDDRAADGELHDLVSADGAEVGWLDEAESAAALDVGPIDLILESESKLPADDEPDARAGLEVLEVDAEDASVADNGEEGPLAEDEELSEKDLPLLDADADGESE